jgi:hypothetical protein
MEYKKWMCYIDGQKNKYSVLNECNRMLKYNTCTIMLFIYCQHFSAPLSHRSKNLSGKCWVYLIVTLFVEVRRAKFHNLRHYFPVFYKLYNENYIQNFRRKHEGKISLRRCYQNLSYLVVDSIYLPHTKEQWRVLVNTAANLLAGSNPRSQTLDVASLHKIAFWK